MTEHPLTCRIHSIEIKEAVSTPLGMKASLLWSADLSDNVTSDLHKIRDYIAREIAMREAVTPAQEPTPSGHKYTLEEFERMGFDLGHANFELSFESAPVDLGDVFEFSETPQGEKYWERIEQGPDGERRAILEDLVLQYEALQHG